MSKIDEARAALAEAEAEDAYLKAKAAYQAAPTPAKKAAKAKAAEKLIAARNEVRKDRKGPQASGGE